MIYEKYLNPFINQKTSSEEFLKLLINLGFVEDFAKYYVKENIKESINFINLKHHLGILIATAQEKVNSTGLDF